MLCDINDQGLTTTASCLLAGLHMQRQSSADSRLQCCKHILYTCYSCMSLTPQIMTPHACTLELGVKLAQHDVAPLMILHTSLPTRLQSLSRLTIGQWYLFLRTLKCLIPTCTKQAAEKALTAAVCQYQRAVWMSLSAGQTLTTVLCTPFQSNQDGICHS